MISRRDFTTWALLGTLLPRPAFAGKHAPLAQAWLRQLHQRCADLRSATLPATDWQDAVEALFGKVSVGDLIAATDFEKQRSETTGESTPALSSEPLAIFPEYKHPKQNCRLTQGASPQWY